MELAKRINDYLSSDAVKSLSRQTQLNYKQGLSRLNAFCEANHLDIFERQINMGDYVNSLKEAGLSGKTIQQLLTYAKIFLKWAGDPIEYTYRLPSEERKELKRKQLKRWFSEDEVARCLAYPFNEVPDDLRLKYRILVRLLAETGARVRELANVQAEHIDLDDNTIWLMDSKTEPRPAFFSSTTQEMLKWWKGGMVFAWTGSIFPTAERIQQIVNQMLDALEINAPGRGPHTFRHFVATRLFYNGMRIEDISFLMGTTVEVIVKTYLHPTPLMLRQRVYKAMKWEE